MRWTVSRRVEHISWRADGGGGRPLLLSGKTILIVEDEALIALDLADTVIASGGSVSGPVATVAEAQLLLAESWIDGALCDAKLADRDVTPLALALIARGVPLVVHSATGSPPELAALHPELPVVHKPAVASKVVETLGALMAQVRT